MSKVHPTPHSSKDFDSPIFDADVKCETESFSVGNNSIDLVKKAISTWKSLLNQMDPCSKLKELKDCNEKKLDVTHELRTSLPCPDFQFRYACCKEVRNLSSNERVQWFKGCKIQYQHEEMGKWKRKFIEWRKMGSRNKQDCDEYWNMKYAQHYGKVWNVNHATLIRMMNTLKDWEEHESLRAYAEAHCMITQDLIYCLKSCIRIGKVYSQEMMQLDITEGGGVLEKRQEKVSESSLHWTSLQHYDFLLKMMLGIK